MAGPGTGPGRGQRGGRRQLRDGRPRRDGGAAAQHVGLLDRFAWLGLLPWGCAAPIALSLAATSLLLTRRV